jgi:acyl-coenzyme A synthetase/AMP-(fatty) acid ligase
LLDADGRPVADGTPGVLHVRTPSASVGYWNHPEHTRRAFADGWFRTGDLLTRDADGFYHHHGRADDVFKVAGQWVTPADVERVLLAHPSVAEAAVVGAAEAGGLVKPFAFVVAANGARDERLTAELTALAADRLPPHQRPRRIMVVDELPRTATGKLQRFVLKERVERA